MSIGQQLLDVPFGEMISSLGLAIAEAQHKLDTNSMDILRQMGEKETVSLPFCRVNYDGNDLTISDEEIPTSMIGAGFQPTFYQFAETIIEVKIAITMSYDIEKSVSVGSEMNSKAKYKKKTVSRTTTVDASYSSKYNYSAEGSSLLRTRLVPVPPNSVISQMLELRATAMQMDFELKRAQIEADIAAAQASISEKAAAVTPNESTTAQ